MWRLGSSRKATDPATIATTKIATIRSKDLRSAVTASPQAFARSAIPGLCVVWWSGAEGEAGEASGFGESANLAGCGSSMHWHGSTRLWWRVATRCSRFGWRGWNHQWPPFGVRCEYPAVAAPRPAHGAVAAAVLGRVESRPHASVCDAFASGSAVQPQPSARQRRRTPARDTFCTRKAASHCGQRLANGRSHDTKSAHDPRTAGPCWLFHRDVGKAEGERLIRGGTAGY